MQSNIKESLKKNTFWPEQVYIKPHRNNSKTRMLVCIQRFTQPFEYNKLSKAMELFLNLINYMTISHFRLIMTKKRCTSLS